MTFTCEGCGATLTPRGPGRAPKRCAKCKRAHRNEDARAMRLARRKEARQKGMVDGDCPKKWARAVEAACTGVLSEDMASRFGEGMAKRAISEARRLGAPHYDPGALRLPPGLPV